MEDEKYGIDIENAHPNAVALIPEEFFWDCVDELAPFGSDEGDTALAEYRNWRTDNIDAPTIECLRWVIESVGEMAFEDYNSDIASIENVKALIEDENFDDQQYMYTLDISVIATGFAQLVDEGVIEAANKSIMAAAIARQIIWARLKAEWEYADRYISNLTVLTRALEQA